MRAPSPMRSWTPSTARPGRADAAGRCRAPPCQGLAEAGVASAPDAGEPEAAVVVDATPAPADATAAMPAGEHPVFALDRLHVVAIEVDASHLATLNDDRNQTRVPARVSYDGVVLPGSGIRKKGYNGSRRDLFDKTGFTVDFHEFAPAQRLHGLKKLTLNNSVQDASFLHEHLAYEVFRRAGLPAPLTAHALLTFNGMPFGLYVVKESVDGEFLDRNFGGKNDQGNLYEGPCCHDFVTNSEKIELKDEVSEMRSRQDLLELAQLIRDTPDAQWEVAVGARLDLDNLIASYAVDAVTDHFDDYFWNGNNYYIYHHPGTGKFLMIPHGADRALWSLRDPLRAPGGQLGQRLRALPSLDQRFRLELRRVVTQAYDLPALHARIDRAAAVILAHPPGDPRTTADFQSLRDNVPELKSLLARRHAWAQTLP